MDQNELEQRLQKIADTHLASMSYHATDSDDCTIRSNNQLSGVISEMRDINTAFELTPQIFEGLKLLSPDVTEKRASLGVSATHCQQKLDDGEYTEDIDSFLLEIIQAYLHEVSRQAQELCEEVGERDKTKETTEQIFARLLNDYIQDLNNQQEAFRKSLNEANDLCQEAQKLADGAKELNASAEEHIEKSQSLINSAIADKERLRVQTKDIQNQVRKAEGSAKKAELKAKNATETAEGMIPNMLTVLGIFVGIIVAVVACYLAILLDKKEAVAIAEKSIPLAFMFTWLMGHVIVMSVFLLLYLTSKLTDKSLACHCKNFVMSQTDEKINMPECCQCVYAKQCNAFVRLRSRFPYIFWINVIFVIGYLVLMIIHLVNLYFADWLYEHVVSNLGIYANVLVASVGVIIIGCILVLLLNKPPKAKKDANSD